MAVSEQFYTTCWIGEKGCGKTSRALGDPEHKVDSFILSHCKKWNMKALFVDNWADRPGYEMIPIVTFDELKAGAFKRGSARVIVDRSSRVEIATVLYESMRNTVICVEDSRMIVPSNISDTPWEDLLISNKNMRCSLIFMFHGFGGIPPKMYQYIDELEIYKTRQDPAIRQREISKYDQCREIWQRVLNHPNQYYHETYYNGS